MGLSRNGADPADDEAPTGADCLLRQPGGLEGLGFVRIETEVEDLAVSQLDEVPESPLDSHPTPPADSVVAERDDDGVTVSDHLSGVYSIRSQASLHSEIQSTTASMPR